MQEIKLPKERIAVLIGIKGKTKRKIEKKTKTKLQVNSKEGDVIIEAEDPVDELVAKNVIQAIGRGFNPDKSLHLIDENYCLEIISIKNYTRDTKNDIERVKARIIGTKGKARKQLEILTETDISVYGKTVSILGETEKVILAKLAIQNLLKGAPHGNVYAYIERQKRIEL